MLLIFLDTETTGLNPENHHAIEIAFKIIEADSFQLLISYEAIICHSREIWANADRKSLEFNGFTYEETLRGKPQKVVESEIITCLNNSKIREKTGCFICQNPSFDRIFFNKIVNAQLQEQYQWPYHWLDLASMYWLFRHLTNKEKINFKEHDLSKDQIALYFNLPLEKSPHRAMNGVNHLMACYQKVMSLPQVHIKDAAEL